MSELYQQALLAHHHSPVGYQKILKANCQKQGSNPICGDEITVSVELISSESLALAFDGDSCAICRASASIMCEQLEASDISTSRHLVNQVEAGFASRTEFSQSLSPLNAVFKFPVRIQCALLPWQTLAQCLDELTQLSKGS